MSAQIHSKGDRGESPTTGGSTGWHVLTVHRLTTKTLPEYMMLCIGNTNTNKWYGRPAETTSVVCA
jgi:hypothetical protein